MFLLPSSRQTDSPSVSFYPQCTELWHWKRSLNINPALPSPAPHPIPKLGVSMPQSIITRKFAFPLCLLLEVRWWWDTLVSSTVWILFQSSSLGLPSVLFLPRIWKNKRYFDYFHLHVSLYPLFSFLLSHKLNFKNY